MFHIYLHSKEQGTFLCVQLINEYVKCPSPPLNQHNHQQSPSGPTSKHSRLFFVNTHTEMQIHGGIWVWFIRLLQSACSQQDSVVRIKGYTIWKRSMHHLSLTPAFFHRWLPDMSFLCCLYENGSLSRVCKWFHAIWTFPHLNHSVSCSLHHVFLLLPKRPIGSLQTVFNMFSIRLPSSYLFISGYVLDQHATESHRNTCDYYLHVCQMLNICRI